MSLRRGGALFLEYAATRPGLRKATQDGLVRRVSTRALVREITAAGGHVVHRETGPGDDFFDRPTPTSPGSRSVGTGRPNLTHPAPRRTHEQSPGSPQELLPQGGRGALVVTDVSAAVHENRRLNRRVAELTDVVAELLVPIADRDEEKARELLERYRETTLAP